MAKRAIPHEFDPEGFALFWQKFPRKEAKVDGYKAWRQEQPLVGVVLDALEWQIPANKWDEQPQYCPLPATYIRGNRWTDERRVDMVRRQQISKVTEAAMRAIAEAK